MQDKKIRQAEGVTATERLLKNLCNHSFLRMWTYPGVFRNQGNAAGGHGKEICDVLVVFANDILIFSDKSCQYNRLVDEQLAWKRWFRKSVWESAGQAWGAERWIREHPDRLFIDRACEQRFPLPLPASTIARFHHIVVAHGLPNRGSSCHSTHFEIDSRFIGLEAHAPEIGPRRPFCIGWLGADKSFVHVFSGDSLRNLLTKLDTVSDFTAYLIKKEKLFREGGSIVAEKEEDLLAVYLRHLNGNGEHDFVFPGRPGPLIVTSGEWGRFETSPQRKSQIQADKMSEGWDWLLGNFTNHILDGTAYYSSAGNLEDREKAFRVMASENRTRRRLLARSLFGLMRLLGNAASKVRVAVPLSSADPVYVFLLVRLNEKEDYECYRARRHRALVAYCMVAKLKYPAAGEIVGLAMEPFDSPEGSQDALYLSGPEWDAAAQANAEELRDKFNLLGNISIGGASTNEYPSGSTESDYIDI